MKELVAVKRGILRFANDLRGHTVCLYEDNQAVVAIIKNRTSSSPLLMSELRLLMALLEQLDIRLVPRYIRSELNPADIFSRLTDRDAWTLSPSVQRMLMQRAQAMFRKSIYLTRCLRLSTVKSDISLRLETLRSRGIGRGWTLARLEQRSRLAEPTVGVVARRSLQTPRGAPSSCAHRTSMVVANVVAIAARSRSIPRRAAAAKVQCLASLYTKAKQSPSSTRASGYEQSFVVLAANDDAAGAQRLIVPWVRCSGMQNACYGRGVENRPRCLTQANGCGL
jgi:hypothetical protein